jgi:hypothetical protein
MVFVEGEGAFGVFDKFGAIALDERASETVPEFGVAGEMFQSVLESLRCEAKIAFFESEVTRGKKGTGNGIGIVLGSFVEVFENDTRLYP